MIAGNDSLDIIQEPESITPPRMAQGRLSHYGSQALLAVRHFVHIFIETLNHIWTALAGSIIMLPVVIVVRAIQVVLGNFFGSLKSLLLSLLRALFDGLRYLISPLHEAFSWYNQQVLKPVVSL